VFTGRVDRHDVGVRESRSNLSLSPESSFQLLVHSQMRQEHFDRNLALEPNIEGTEYDAHPTLAQRFPDLVLATHGFLKPGPEGRDIRTSQELIRSRVRSLAGIQIERPIIGAKCRKAELSQGGLPP